MNQTLKHPYDRHGVPTEWLVIAETLSDARVICMEGPAGILRVLERRKIKHRYKMSPRPMVLFPSGSRLYTEGADDPDVGRGYNASGAWLDEICVAKGELVTTIRGRVPVELVRVGDRVITRGGAARVTFAGLTRRCTRILEVRTSAGSVRVTPDHQVWANGRWVEAQYLAPGDIMATCATNMKNLSLAKRLPSMTGTVSAGTTTNEWATTSTAPVPFSIDASGPRSMVPSQMATKSIMSIGLDGMFDWRTLSFCPDRTIEVSQELSEKMWPGNRTRPLRQPLSISLPIGSDVNLVRSSARSAGNSTSARGCGPSTATRTVEQRLDVKRTRALVTSVVEVEPSDVYDLTVEGDHPEFYAGSGQLLVHNCKWKYPKASWDAGIMPSLRADLMGDHPRAFVTTTPKPVNIIQEWADRKDGSVHIIRGSTFDNRSNLSALVVEELQRRYEGTLIGRQELYGEIIEGFEGALFSRLDIENNRVDTLPDDIVGTVVGIDPSLTGEDDEMGIVVVSRSRSNHLYVLADRSIMSVGRQAALEAWRVVWEWGADRLICETNLGKRWMQQVFEDAYYELVNQGLFERGTKPPMVAIDAKTGKRTRGEPVAMRCEQGRLHCVGRFKELEDQMATFVSWGQRDSPDRLDALVHACRFLMDGEKKQVKIISPRDALSSTLQSLWTDAGSYRSDF